MMHIKVALAKAGVTQIELATRLGIHPSALSRIVCGWQHPPKQLAEDIEKRLDVGRVTFGRRATGRGEQKGSSQRPKGGRHG